MIGIIVVSTGIGVDWKALVRSGTSEFLYKMSKVGDVNLHLSEIWLQDAYDRANLQAIPDHKAGTVYTANVRDLR